MGENQLKNQANASVGDETSESADAVLGGDLVRDATITEFPQLVELSKQIPMMLDMWAPWCVPCRQLGPVLERLVQEYAGKIALAKVNVDEQAELAQAFRVQGVPAVFLLLDRHPVPPFTGALPASTIRAAFDEVLEPAASQGVAGRLQVHGTPAGSLAPRETPEPELPETLREAAKLVTAREFTPVVKAYEEYVRESLEEEAAVAPLLTRARPSARIENDSTTVGVAAVEHGNAAPTADAPAQLTATDAELNVGNTVETLSRLLAMMRMTTGADREAARARMVRFFATLGDDPIVPAMHSRLATLLYQLLLALCRLAVRCDGTHAAHVAGLSVLVECLSVSVSGGFALLAAACFVSACGTTRRNVRTCGAEGEVSPRLLLFNYSKNLIPQSRTRVALSRHGACCGLISLSRLLSKELVRP